METKPLKLSPFTRMRFGEWQDIAHVLNTLQARLVFNEGEIWSCHVGMNIGNEQMGIGEEFLRPVVIVKKFNDYICWTIPLTRTIKSSKYYYIFEFGSGSKSAAVLLQMRLIDAQRLHRMIGIMKRKNLYKMKKRLITFLS